MELEVEANLVLSRHIKVRVSDGSLLAGSLLVYESEDPYVLVLTITPDDPTFLTGDDEDIIRLDIFKEDLSRELKLWLDGKYIHHPAALVPVRVDDAIIKFVKFAKTPRQEDLIMWILSRSELHRAGSVYELVFGGIPLDDQEDDVEKLKMSISNKYNKTATIAAALTTHDDTHYTLGKSPPPPATSRPSSATFSRSLKPKNNEDLGMFDMTRKLLGKSATLQSMKTQKVKGREGARQTLAMSQQTLHPESYLLVNEIERSRKDIMDKMENRRRMIEVAKVRQLQSAEKYRFIASQKKMEKQGAQFVHQARQELLTLQTIEFEIDDDIMKQKTRIHRGTQKVIWTKAPNGFSHLRGKSQRGPVLGPGPLPANATTALKDPAIERTIQQFYWDQAGRRHRRQSGQGDDQDENASIVEMAMNAIRKAAANLSAFKLDLKAVFQQFDTSGDGFLSPQEMAQAFLAMGVKLDLPSINVIFRHFDPNQSGSVHYGEFVWAFFNRRALIRQWRRKTTGLTAKQVRQRFHQADTNGNGRLNAKEFAKLLGKGFDIHLPAAEIEILMDRFDVDGDGELDLNEFYSFLQAESAALFDGSHSASPEGSRSLSPTASGARGNGVPPHGSQDMPSKEALQAEARTRGGLPARSLSAPRSRRSSGEGNERHGTEVNAGFHRPSSAKNMSNVSATMPRQSSAAPQPPSQAHSSRPSSLPYGTAPAALEKLAVDVQRNKMSRDQEEGTVSLRPPRVMREKGTEPQSLDHGSGPEQITFPEEGVASVRTHAAVESDDVLWMSRMLQAQAEIESRVGQRYFRSRHV